MLTYKTKFRTSKCAISLTLSPLQKSYQPIKIHPMLQYYQPTVAPPARGGIGGHCGRGGLGSGRSSARQYGHVPRLRSHQSMPHSAWKK